MSKITPFLTFGGNAHAALDFYLSIFPKANVKNIAEFDIDERLPEGQILNATLSLMESEINLMDIEAEYAVPFSWATSFYIDCQNEEEFDDLFTKLSVEGSVMMGPEPVLQFRKVAWVTDKFGVTWQLVWE